MLRLLLLFTLFCSLTLGDQNIYPNSCADLDDGEQLLKLLDGDEYPVVKVNCNNGYMILDYSLDNNIEKYFDTFYEYYKYYSGPEHSVVKNWEEWFYPSASADTDNLEFLLSDDCSSCDSDSVWNYAYNTKSTYWLTGQFNSCFWRFRGTNQCDMSIFHTNEYQCYLCGHGVATFTGDEVTEELLTQYKEDYTLDEFKQQLETTGICTHTIRESTHWMPTTHDECTIGYEDSLLDHVRPSIGTGGTQCVCYKNNADTQFYEGTYETPTVEVAEDTDTGSVDDVYELYQSDFKTGTYRITKSGTYKIMEDIEFDFNNMDDTNADSILEAWKPLTEQRDDYPGANDYKDIYFLGFFAGITVEVDDVIIDLNEHELAMSKLFYFQQRWFTNIELSKQYFFPGQGFGHFGSYPHASQNVIIKNGKLGLTGHHGIHGNYNKNIKIENVHVYNFETHGIQMNGFDGIELTNVEIGPTSSIAYFSGEYAHWRYLLPRLQNAAVDTDESLQFYGRDKSVTLQDIADEIELKMEYAWNYVVNGIDYTEDDSQYDDFVDALNIFVNMNGGITYASAQQGLFLNTYGASVFNYNLYTGYRSNDAKIDGLKIHGLRHEFKEYLRFFTTNKDNNIRNPFNGPLQADYMIEDWSTFDIDDFRDGKIPYKGNIVTDAIIAMNMLNDNWDYLGIQFIMNDQISAWALNNDNSGIQDRIGLGCNGDVMLHSGKGIIGLRIDGVDNVYLNNIEIYDNYDTTPLGSTTCGEYDQLDYTMKIGGHFRQRLPMQYGFSGNMNQAIVIDSASNIYLSNINIHDLSSDYGPVFGISIWPTNDIIVNDNINVYNLNAGIGLEKGSLTYDDLPNRAPEACAVRVYEYYNVDDEFYSTVITDDASSLDVNYYCIDGHTGCFNGEYDDIIAPNFDGDSCNVEDYESKYILNNQDYSMLGTENTDMTCSESIHKSENRQSTIKILNKLHTPNKHWPKILNIIMVSVPIGISTITAILLYFYCNNRNNVDTIQYTKLKTAYGATDAN